MHQTKQVHTMHQNARKRASEGLQAIYSIVIALTAGMAKKGVFLRFNVYVYDGQFVCEWSTICKCAKCIK